MMPVAKPAGLAFIFVAALGLHLSADAQQPVPYFEPGPCPLAQETATRGFRLECGALVVAQNRAEPEGKRLRLAVVILRPTQRSSETPLVILHGGPSGPGGIRAGSMALAVRWSRALERDIVVYDQRGVGFSEPALCPDVVARVLEVRNEVSEAERERGFDEVAAACVASLRRDGVDPLFFNSVTNAADLTDLRTVLGYEQWDVLGVSYGSRLAQEAMRRDPMGVRSAVLVSPLIPGVARAGTTLAFQVALENVFAECGAQPTCRAAFPSPEQDLYELLAELDAAPIDVVVERDGSPFTVQVNGRRLLSDIIGRFSTAEINRLPLLLHELRRGDRAEAARVLVGAGVGTNAINNVLTNLVSCYDFGGTAEYRRAAEELQARLVPAFRPFVSNGAQCSIYMDRFATPEELELVRSDIPTLILTQQFDDRTTTEHGRQIASNLAHAYLFELPGLGHAATPAGCVDTLVLGFLADPTQQPDASCIATMPRLAFETERLERPTVFFTIRSNDPADPFAGTWDAVVPNTPRRFDFALVIGGNTVTGNVTAGGGALNLPIFDGTVNGATMSFKVNSPEGGRTVTFTGTVEDEQISFVRDVEVPPGGDPGGAGMWGALAVRTFRAQRQ